MVSGHKTRKETLTGLIIVLAMREGLHKKHRRSVAQANSLCYKRVSYVSPVSVFQNPCQTFCVSPI